MTLAVDIAARFSATGAETFVVDVAFEVAEGESLVVLGPSGSGKTLVLETIAGFHSHSGTIENDGRDLTDLPPEKRGFGFVFQDYALFPHMTVRENVAFGARYHDAARDPAVVLAELGVSDLADRTPPTLSGGEAQRVALARSLAVDPDVFLLDEPLSALDVPTRRALRDDVVDLLADVTAVYVTHNRITARAVADRIAVMRGGEIVQVGTPEAVFERPQSPFVARFTGANCCSLDALGDLGETLRENGATYAAIRPEYVELDPDPDTDAGESDVEATVKRCIREDATNRITVSLPGTATETSRQVGARSADGGRRTGGHGEETANENGSENPGSRHQATLDAFSDRSPAVGDRVGISLPREHVTLFE